MTATSTLTAAESQVCDAFVQTGSNQAVAMQLRVSENAVYQALRRAREKFGVDNNVLLAVQWDRMQRQSEGAQ